MHLHQSGHWTLPRGQGTETLHSGIPSVQLPNMTKRCCMHGGHHFLRADFLDVAHFHGLSLGQCWTVIVTHHLTISVGYSRRRRNGNTREASLKLERSRMSVAYPSGVQPSYFGLTIASSGRPWKYRRLLCLDPPPSNSS